MSNQTQVVKQQQSSTYGTIKAFIEARSGAIAELVPRHLSPDRLIKVLLNSIYKTPKLQECTASSLMQCALTAAELGLEPGGALGHAYLVPYKTTATFIIGYRGLVELMRRSGQLSSIRAVVVHARDKFSYREGIEQVIEHEPLLEGDPGPLRFVYAVAKLKDGSVQCEFMTRAQVDGIRARSRSGNDGPWVTDFEEMAKKTVIRRIAKVLPLSSEAEKALEVDSEDFIDSTVVEQAIAAPDAQAEAKEAVKARRRLRDFAPESPPMAAEPEHAPPPSEPPPDVVLPKP